MTPDELRGAVKRRVDADPRGCVAFASAGMLLASVLPAWVSMAAGVCGLLYASKRPPGPPADGAPWYRALAQGYS